MQPKAVATWRALLAKIDGVEYVELAPDITCCGAGGSYRFDQAKRSAKLGEIMAEAIHALKPDLVLSANVGCLAQLRTHLQHNKDQSKSLDVVHPLSIHFVRKPLVCADAAFLCKEANHLAAGFGLSLDFG